MSNRRVVVTGIGCITPVGLDSNESWRSITEGVSGAGPITLFPVDDNYNCRIAAEVKGFDPESVVSKKDAKRYDRFSLFALKAAREAWVDCGIKEDDYENRGKVGCILGVGIGGLPVMEENHKELLEGGPRKISPFLIPAMIANLAPGNIAIDLNLRGVNFVITSACTSGTHAIGEAYRMIKFGIQDCIVTGGAEAAITPIGVGGFGRMRALTTRNDEPTKASRPFDKDRDGFLIGEGAGILVLEEYEAAKKRGAKIYCEVYGYGASCDAYHITGQREDAGGAVDCMKLAIADAEVKPEDIGYINAHGTSTPLNDPTETKAIKTVFGSYAKEGLLVSSTKSMTGHSLGAAGAVEGVILAKTVFHDLVPPTINLDNPDPDCDLDYIPHKAREKKVAVALSNSFGFGGTNGSIIFGKLR